MDDTTAVPASPAPETTEEPKKRLTRLERLEAKLAEAAHRAQAAKERQQLIERELKREAALAAKAARKADARTKILIGGALLALLDRGNEDARALAIPLVGASKKHDREHLHAVLMQRWENRPVAPGDGAAPEDKKGDAAD